MLLPREGGLMDIFWCPLAMHMCYILSFYVYICVCLSVPVSLCATACADVHLFVCVVGMCGVYASI